MKIARRAFERSGKRERNEGASEYGLSRKRRVYSEERERERKTGRHWGQEKNKKKVSAKEATKEREGEVREEAEGRKEMAPIPVSDRTTFQQQSQQEESILSALSMRHPNETPSQKTLPSGMPADMADVSRRKSPSPSVHSTSTLPKVSSPAISSPPPKRSKPNLTLTSIASASSASISTLRDLSQPPPTTAITGTATTLSPQEPVIRGLEVHTVCHHSPIVTYFHTRFVRNVLKSGPDEWSAPDMRADKKCIKSRGFSWNSYSSFSGAGSEVTDEDEEEARFDIGGSVLWEGCSSDEEEQEGFQLQTMQEQKGNQGCQEDVKEMLDASRKGREPSVVPRTVVPHPGSMDTAYMQPTMPVPKIDLSQVLRSQKTASARRKRKAKEGEGGTATPLPASRSAQANRTVPQTSSSHIQPQLLPQPSSAQLSEPPRYLSEKARGKQKAIDPTPASPGQHSAYHNTLLSPIAATDFCDPIMYSPTNTFGGSHHPVSLHEIFERNLEEHTVFDMELLDKSRDSGEGPSAAGAPVTIPNLASPSSTLYRADGSPFRSQSNTDLFLISSLSSVGPSMFRPLDAFASYHDPNRVSLDGEKGEQVMTINPAFLDGGHEDSSSNYLNETDLKLKLGGMADDEQVIEVGKGTLEANIHNETLDADVEHQPVAGSPITRSPSASSSSSRPSRSQSPFSAPARPGLTPLFYNFGRTSRTPEFLDHQVGSCVPQAEDGPPISSHSTSLALAEHKFSNSRAKAFGADEDEAEEEAEVQQNLEATSTSDEDFIGSSESEDSRPSRQARRTGPIIRKKHPKAEPLPARSTSASAFTPAKDSISVSRAQEWECGEEVSYCHQCRRKTSRLKMTCLCEKKFCNRCISVRYISFISISLSLVTNNVVIATHRFHFVYSWTTLNAHIAAIYATATFALGNAGKTMSASGFLWDRCPREARRQLCLWLNHQGHEERGR